MQYQRPMLRQEQRQKMSLQLIQSINLLPLTVTELKQKIEEELERNPALEAADDRTLVSFDELDARSGHRVRSSASFDEEDTQRRFLEGVISRGEGLHDHLLWQLKLHPLSEGDQAAGEKLINNLDGNGFHLEPVESLFPDGHDPERLAKLLGLIQTLEPQGCGVVDWKESLRVQMRLEGLEPDHERLVTDYWEALEKRKYKEVAAGLKMTEDDLKVLIEDLKDLNPFPGRAYSLQPPAFVVPDALIAFKGDTLQLVLNEEEIPILRVGGDFQEGFELAAEDKEAKLFVRQKVADAERFIQNLRYRKNTLFKVCRAIMEFQVEFFRRGPKYLKPLTLKDVAGLLEINESTVSRVTTGKYVQTEWGIYELKHFFSNAVNSDQFSKEGVKETIREILAANKDGKKLSDQKISDLLSQRGIEIARRTVTKYRLELAKEYA
jgi:RNA polymerase sigma-54 factor